MIVGGRWLHQFVDYRLEEFRAFSRVFRFPGASLLTISRFNEEAGLALIQSSNAKNAESKEWGISSHGQFPLFMGMAAVMIRAISNDTAKHGSSCRQLFCYQDENNNFILLNYKLSRIYHWVRMQDLPLN